MPLLFKELRAGGIVQKLDSRTKVMTITRKGDSNQTITVKGWTKVTYSVVYGTGMTALGKFSVAGEVSFCVLSWQAKACRGNAWRPMMQAPSFASRLNCSDGRL